jgi:hypothetical protein
MENDLFKKWPAKKHNHPIPVQGNCLARRRDIIQRLDTVSKPAPDGLQTIKENLVKLSKLKFPDVFKCSREPRIHMITLDAIAVGRLTPEFQFAPVAAKMVEHQPYRRALAMVRRRDVGKNEQFHCDLRFTIYDERAATWRRYKTCSTQ